MCTKRLDAIIRSIFFLLLLQIFLFTNSYSQSVQEKRQFEIKVAGIKIGDLEAQQVKENLDTNYSLKSNVSFWFFGKLFVDFLINAKYGEDRLLNSIADLKSNRGEFLSTIIWKKNFYEVDANTYKFENTDPVKQSIDLSVSKLYFKKPKHNQLLISETYGLVSLVKEVEPNVFEIEIDGNRNQFHYKGDELDKVIIQNPIKNYVIQRVY